MRRDDTEKSTHYPLGSLGDRFSQARWAANPAGQAIVFVHGFKATA
jgi:hypothetical protein